jgi:hypothetical protein
VKKRREERKLQEREGEGEGEGEEGEEKDERCMVREGRGQARRLGKDGNGCNGQERVGDR